MKFVAILSIFFIFTAHIYTDQRTENIDCFILLDKSLSMVEEIDAVADYINNEIVGKILIPGDYIMVLQFFGHTEPLLVKDIGSEEIKTSIKNTIGNVLADGYYTDIGNALDVLKSTLDTHDSSGRRQYLLLITDGIQEAPPESIYYTGDEPNPDFSHVYMENAKVIKKQGWKIHILGIGTLSSAQEVADTLSGTFSTVTPVTSDTGETAVLPEDQLRESTKEFLGTIRVIDEPQLRISNMKGEGTLRIQLESDGYANTREIRISDVYLTVPSGRFRIGGPASAAIEPDDIQSLVLDIGVPAGIEDTLGEVEFLFTDNLVFTPSVMDISIIPPGFLARYGLLILLIILAFVILAVLVMVIRNLMANAGDKVSLDVFIGDTKEASLTVAEGTKLFINEGLGGIGVSIKKTGEVLGDLTCRLNQLILEPIKEDRFTGARISGNILEKTLKIKDRFGTFVSLKISRH